MLHFSLRFWCCWQSYTFLGLQMHRSNPGLHHSMACFLYVSVSLFYKDASCIGLGTHPNHLFLHLILHFQIRWHTEVPEVLTSTYLFRGHI